jgi:broad specificity phosphatase PhoE
MADEPDIVLVRHGDTEWSSSGKHTSYTDVPLTERGRAQAGELGPRLAGLGDRAEVTEDLAEWDYGEYEWRTTPEIRRTVPHWTIFSHGVPGGESAREVGQRADRVLERARSASPAALFSHGHFLRVLGARWIGLSPNDGRLLGLDVATLCVLGHEHEEPVLRAWNA